MKQDLLSRLQALVISDVDVVPKGFLTIQQWAEKWGRSRSHTAKLITAGLKAGLIEGQKFRVKVEESAPRRVVHYRETTGKK